MKKFICLVGLICIFSTFSRCEIPANTKTSKGKKMMTTKKQTQKQEPKVTFVELGSVNCIPCKMMQNVMKEIEKDCTGQVNVIFYDVWTEAGRPYSEKYKIKLIPTQVFLDKDGKEFYRHEGFFPEEEILKILEPKGVKVKKN